MIKKVIAAGISVFAVLSLSLFSLGNAFALEHEAAGQDGAAPLTSAREVCKEAKRTRLKDIAHIRAKGLSLHLPKEEVNSMLRELKDYQAKVCQEAEAYAPLTSAVKLCAAAKKNYKADVKAARAKALSLHIPKEELRATIQGLKDYRKLVCEEAKAEAKKQ